MNGLAYLITVPGNSVADKEKLRVQEKLEELGCSVVFLEFDSTSIAPIVHELERE